MKTRALFFGLALLSRLLLPALAQAEGDHSHDPGVKDDTVKKDDTAIKDSANSDNGKKDSAAQKYEYESFKTDSPDRQIPKKAAPAAVIADPFADRNAQRPHVEREPVPGKTGDGASSGRPRTTPGNEAPNETPYDSKNAVDRSEKAKDRPTDKAGGDVAGDDVDDYLKYRQGRQIKKDQPEKGLTGKGQSTVGDGWAADDTSKHASKGDFRSVRGGNLYPDVGRDSAPTVPRERIGANVTKKDDEKKNATKEKAPEETITDNKETHNTDFAKIEQAGGANQATLVKRTQKEVIAAQLNLIARAFARPNASRLDGTPLKLVDALGFARDLIRRRQITHAYWRMAEKVAAYHFALDELTKIDLLLYSDTRKPTAAELVVRTAAKANLLETQIAAIESQHALAGLMMRPDDGTLPLPQDLPLVGAYNTRFSSIFRNRIPSAQARRINHVLPLRYDLIQARFQAVALSGDRFSAAVTKMDNSSGNIATPLEAIVALRDHRRAFFRSVVAYNDDVADYAFDVAGPDIAPGTLVSMLIVTKREGTKQRDQGNSVLKKSKRTPSDPSKETQSPRRAESKDGFIRRR